METDPSSQKQSGLETVIKAAMLVGVCAIAAYVGSAGRVSFWQGCQTLAVAASIGSASLMFGGLFGFLFGLPRSGTSEDNTNLVEVSDWLTKILVGAGLVTLTKIPPKIEALVRFLGTEGFSDAHHGPVFALALIVLYSVCGFLWFYRWTRLFFRAELSDLEKLYKNLRSAPVESLLLQALSLPPDLENEETTALRKQADFMGKTELDQNPESRVIAIKYSRFLDEQLKNSSRAIQVLQNTLNARRSRNVSPDEDDRDLHFNLACYINRSARAEIDPVRKQKLQTDARQHLEAALKIDPNVRSDIQQDRDLNDLGY